MPPEEQVAAPSVEESLNAAIETVAPAETTEAAAPAAEAAPGRVKDLSTGRFVGKQDAPRTADTPGHIGAPAAPEAANRPPVAEEVPAPASWKDNVKAKWATLDPEIRQEIQRRERDISVGLQRAAETRKFGDSILQEMAPYMDILNSEGATPQQAVKTLMETAYILRNGSPENKKHVFLQLMQQYGVDMRQGFNLEVARLQAQVDSMNHEQLRVNAQAQHGVLEQASNEVENFAAQSGREYLEVLRPHMVALLQSGQANSLEEAYDQSAWAHPQVRPLMVQQANLARQAELTRNRNAASSVTGAPGAVSTATSAGDGKNLRATLESAFAGGRV